MTVRKRLSVGKITPLVRRQVAVDPSDGTYRCLQMVDGVWQIMKAGVSREDADDFLAGKPVAVDSEANLL